MHGFLPDTILHTDGHSPAHTARRLLCIVRRLGELVSEFNTWHEFIVRQLQLDIAPWPSDTGLLYSIPARYRLVHFG